MRQQRPADGEDGSILLPSSDIAAAIAALERAGREALADRWRSFYRADPPKGMSRRFLIAGIAFEMQVRQAGRARARVRRRLERLAGAMSVPGGARGTPSRTLDTGARLIREWNGSTHTVDVEADGYVWNGVRHRSLSAIARAITGTRWSGPRFFGLGREDGR